jgi:Putative lumazine-binding
MIPSSRWLVSVLLAGAPTLTAQQAPDRTAILAAVDSLFLGMKTGDTALMARAVDSQATVVAVVYRDGPPRVVSVPFRASLARVATSTDRAEERLLAAEVWQDGDVAMIWAPYQVSRGGAVLHCGFDSFDLIRRDGRWLITNGAYTARPDGCPAVRAVAAGPPPLPAPSPEERATVMAALDSFFVALRERDPALLGRAVSSRATWTTAAYRNGAVILRRRPASQDAETLTQEKEALHERLMAPVVRVDGDIALVWSPYQFHIGERLSHCGHDGFRLVREGGRWRLDGGLYTVRPEGCPAP